MDARVRHWPAATAGDQVTVLKRTGSGFIAAGVNTPDGDQAKATPVIFLSSGGTSWSRLGADRLHLAAGSGRALDIRLAAATGQLILIAGDVATPTTVTSGGSRHEVTVRTGGAWLSDDGGLSWTPVTVPTGRGAQDQFSDAAATTDGSCWSGPRRWMASGPPTFTVPATARPGRSPRP